MSTLLTVCALVMAGGAAQETTAAGPAAEFEAPAQITAGGKAIEDLYYPTPVLFDVDGDERLDLVVGDLMGIIHYSPAAETDDDTAWSTLQKLQCEGKDLRLNNW